MKHPLPATLFLLFDFFAPYLCLFGISSYYGRYINDSIRKKKHSTSAYLGKSFHLTILLARSLDTDKKYGKRTDLDQAIRIVDQEREQLTF